MPVLGQELYQAIEFSHLTPQQRGKVRGKANMSEMTPSLFSEAFRAELEEIVQRAVEKALKGNGLPPGDRLLDAEKAAEILGVSSSWLYRYGKRLPFTRKLAPRVLRFSYQGIQKYLSTRKNS